MSIDLGFFEILSIFSAIFAVLLAIVVGIYSRNRAAGYDDEMKVVKLELYRRSIEKEISDLNNRLVSTESRWRDANHLLMSSQDMLQRSPSAISSRREAEGSSRRVDERMVFVMTPFNKDYLETFTAISLACTRLGLRAVRGDEEFIKGEVFPHILDLIERAGIIVANIDGRNPNVFYELGIAQALGKKTILVSKRPSDVPFDVRTNRIVIYKRYSDLVEQLQLELGRAVVHGFDSSLPPQV